MEGGAFQSKKVAKASLDYVFVFQHQTRASSCDSYKLVTEKWLPEDFLHPVYLFLRPDGIEANEEDRNYHTALSGQKILKVLQKIQKEWGPGLRKKKYEAANAEIDEANALMAKGDWKGGEKLLRKVAGMKARCGVRDRAAATLAGLDVRKELVEAWRGIEGVGKDRGVEVDRLLAAGDLPGAYRILRRAAREGPETEFRERVVEALRKMIRLEPVRFEKLILKAGTYHYVYAEWATDLPPFDGLVLQLSYVTDRDRTLESYGVYDSVAPNRHHRAAVSLSYRDLRMQEVENVRVQLWVEDVLLHESLWKESPTEFPEDTSHVKWGPELMTEEDNLGVSNHSKLRESVIGRYSPGT